MNQTYHDTFVLLLSSSDDDEDEDESSEEEPEEDVFPSSLISLASMFPETTGSCPVVKINLPTACLKTRQPSKWMHVELVMQANQWQCFFFFESDYVIAKLLFAFLWFTLLTESMLYINNCLREKSVEREMNAVWIHGGLIAFKFVLVIKSKFTLLLCGISLVCNCDVISFPT